jgi:hypothetical protein
MYLQYNSLWGKKQNNYHAIFLTSKAVSQALQFSGYDSWQENTDFISRSWKPLVLCGVPDSAGTVLHNCLFHQPSKLLICLKIMLKNYKVS